MSYYMIYLYLYDSFDEVAKHTEIINYSIRYFSFTINKIGK